MIRNILMLLAAAALAASANYMGDSRLHAGFPDGTVIDFSTETTGSTQLTSTGGGAGSGKHGIYRVVSDKNGGVLFAYLIEAFAGPQPGEVTIRIKPLDADTEADLHNPRSGWHISGRVPTVSAAREFPGVQRGQAVRFEILHNPSTGETIYDVLRPSADASPYSTGVWGVYATPAGEEMSFREIALFVNGEKIAAPAGPFAGAAARLYLPGRGAYYLSANQPKGKEFQHIAYVDRRNLEFAIDGDFLRITSAGNVLTHADAGTLWVYHDARYQPVSQSGSQPASRTNLPEFVFADNVESLLPR